MSRKCTVWINGEDKFEAFKRITIAKMIAHTQSPHKTKKCLCGSCVYTFTCGVTRTFCCIDITTNFLKYLRDSTVYTPTGNFFLQQFSACDRGRGCRDCGAFPRGNAYIKAGMDRIVSW